MHPLDPLPLGDASFSLGTDPVYSKGLWGWRSDGMGCRDVTPCLSSLPHG